MSIVFAQPEILAAAAGELHTIITAVRAGNSVADYPTIGAVPAAADLVSLLTAAQFAAHAWLYQAISAQAVTAQDHWRARWASAPSCTRSPRPPMRRQSDRR